jgi:hypothetical protein
MRRNVRNILAELLLESFNDPEKRAAIEWLAEFFRIAAWTGGVVVPLNRLPMLPLEAESTGTGMGTGRMRDSECGVRNDRTEPRDESREESTERLAPRTESRESRAVSRETSGERQGRRTDTDRDSEKGGGIPRGAEKLAGMEKLLRLRRADAGEAVALQSATDGGRGLWLVEPVPEVRAEFSAVCERVRIYAGMIGRMGTCDPRANNRDPLAKAMGEAALCFNAGLFFEAHEHLEHHWAATPKGPVKRFLQGIIQISVGFYQACAGKYDGTINQLGKGLEKTSGMTGEFLGLDCEAFLPKVAAVRDAIVRRGRAHMRALTLQEVPHMPIRR